MEGSWRAAGGTKEPRVERQSLAPAARAGAHRAIFTPIRHNWQHAAVAARPPTTPARGGREAILCSAQRPRRLSSKRSTDGKQPPDVATPALVVEATPAAVQAPSCVEQQIAELEALLSRLSAVATYADKTAILKAEPAAKAFFATREGGTVARQLGQLGPKEAYCLAALPALGQAHVLGVIPTGIVLNDAFERLAAALARVEDFYDSIGGVAGYQLQCLRLIAEQRSAAAAGGGGGGEGEASASGGGAALASGAGSAAAGETQYLVPPGLDLGSADPAAAAVARAATLAGIEALPAMAEICPLGGAGDRLGLACEDTGESLPTAVLQYCGRSLLENLMRDLQAREYLYWHLHGRQLTTPLAVMTSAAKGNHWRVAQLFERNAWFGRGREAVRLFQQPLVPLVCADDGRWLLSSPLKARTAGAPHRLYRAPPVEMKPGGHGVIWKLMIDEGVFSWLVEQGREAAIVRQISNPISGAPADRERRRAGGRATPCARTDTTLLALAGAGYSRRRAFGFASCDRVVGAAEGVNVLAEQRLPSGGDEASSSSSTAPGGGQRQRQDGGAYSYRITNVEYTEFARLGVADASVDETSNHSVFPANANVLYAAERTVRASMAASSTDALLPGMILNLGKKVRYQDAWLGAEREVHAGEPAGRLECTMQNLADCLGTRFDRRLGEEELAGADLDTFLVTSSAKRKLAPGSTHISQTPDGSFYSLQQNAAELLARCGVAAPPLGGVAQYLATGPGFIFLFHPGLGPLWDVIAQKVRGGSIAERSEVQLEVAELCWEDVHVAGSLIVRAAVPLGHFEDTEQPAEAEAGAVVAGLPAPDAAPNRAVGQQPSAAAAASSPAVQQPLEQQGRGQQRWQQAEQAANSAVSAGLTAFSIGTANNHHLRGLWHGAGSSSAAAAGVEEEAQDPAYSQPCTGVSHLDSAMLACPECTAAPRLAYSDRAARVRLHRVRIANVGVDWAAKHNVYWRHKVARHEACRVLLRGRSEFEARDVILAGDLTFEVPDGYRMLVSATPDGRWKAELQPLPLDAPPSWAWHYRLAPRGGVALALEEARVAVGGGPGGPPPGWAGAWPERNQTSTEDMYFI
eukprot:scaffold6.g2643.t1